MPDEEELQLTKCEGIPGSRGMPHWVRGRVRPVRFREYLRESQQWKETLHVVCSTHLAQMRTEGEPRKA